MGLDQAKREAFARIEVDDRPVPIDRVREAASRRWRAVEHPSNEHDLLETVKLVDGRVRIDVPFGVVCERIAEFCGEQREERCRLDRVVQ